MKVNHSRGETRERNWRRGEWRDWHASDTIARRIEERKYRMAVRTAVRNGDDPPSFKKAFTY